MGGLSGHGSSMVLGYRLGAIFHKGLQVLLRRKGVRLYGRTHNRTPAGHAAWQQRGRDASFQDAFSLWRGLQLSDALRA